MTIYEQITEIKNNTTLNPDNYLEAYTKAEAELVDLAGQKAIGLEVNHQRYGIGKILSYRSGGTLDCLVVNIEFDIGIKQFSLAPILDRITDNAEITEIWNSARLVHNELTDTYNELETARLQAEREAKIKAEEERKATKKYEARKEKALKEFDDLTKQGKSKCGTGEFYYALGWLAKNVGTIRVALPDYLLNSFERHFGTDCDPYVVDSKKRTTGGYAFQWSIGMSATIPKKAQDSIPAVFFDYLNPNKTALTNTSFIWDLVDNYGFSFGKEQDLDKIKDNIPTHCIVAFENGLGA